MERINEGKSSVSSAVTAQKSLVNKSHDGNTVSSRIKSVVDDTENPKMKSNFFESLMVAPVKLIDEVR